MTSSKLLSAAAVISAVLMSAGPVLSQARSQLEAQVASQASQHNVKIENMDALTDTQLSQVALYFGTSESQASHRAAIEALLANKEPCVGNAQMRASVADQLSQYGITNVDADLLTGAQLAVLQAVLSSTAPETAIDAQVQRVLSDDAPMTGNDQLRFEAGQCVGQFNADVNLDALSPEELVQIQLIGGGSGSANEKRRQIEQLAAQ